MAKFNIEVKLDWINDEEYSIDDEIREQVIQGVKDKLLEKATDEAVKAVDKEIYEKIEQAKETIDAKVEEFISHICEDSIAKMQIPYKTSSWSDEVKYTTMSEYVGIKYEEYLNKKVYDNDGSVARYDSDRKMSINEYFINKYLQKNLAVKVSEMIKTAQKEAEEMVLKTLEQNLKDQLAADTVKRLNIPKLLENLQNKALEFEKESEVSQ